MTASGAGITSYSWSTGNTTSSISVNTAGTYSVTVTNAAGCTNTANVTISNAPAVNVNISGSTLICPGGSTTLDAGAGFSTYIWNTGQTSRTISVNSAGNYSVTVTNASGCTGTGSINVTLLSAPNPNITGPTIVCSGGSISLDAGPGFSNYSWNTGATTRTITVTTPGTYAVTVTNSNGCQGTDNISIAAAPPVVVDILGSNSVCQGSSITLDAGAGFASYLWNTGASTRSISVSTAGTYAVTVTTGSGCTGTDNVVVVSLPTPTVNILGPTAVCTGGNVTLDAGAGFSSYNWSTGATTRTITINSPGTYTVTVTNASTCTASDAHVVVGVNSPSINDITDQIACGAYILPPISGTNLTGNQAYFTGSNATGTSYNAGDTITASTTLFIFDGAPGCSSEQSFNITINTTPNINPPGDQVTCGSYTLPPISGMNLSPNAAYFTATNGGGTRFNPGDAITTSTTLFVFDSNGTCSDEKSFIITINPSPSINDIADQSACAAYTLPAITGSNLTGNQAYFTGSNGSGTRFNPGQIISTSLTLFIFDSDGGNCLDQESFAIAINPNPAVNLTATNVSCNAAQDGMISITITGAAPFMFDWNANNLDGQQNVAGLAPGNYAVTITDNNGCRDTVSATITEPQALVLNCAQQASALEANIAINGGTAPYSLSWTGPTAGTQLANTPGNVLLNGLVIGTYQVTVTDANGCQATCTFDITFPCDLAVSLTPTDVSCNGGSDGAIQSMLTGGTAPLVFDWNVNTLDGAANAVDLIAGLYILTTRDANGCRDVDTVIIAEPVPFNLSCRQLSPATTVGGSDGIAQITFSGNNAPFTIAWTGPVSGNTTVASGGQNIAADIPNLSVGNYEILLTDANGCSTTCNFSINDPSCNLSVGISKQNESCPGTADGSIELNVSGGTPPFTYDWNNDALDGTQDPAGLSPANYIVTITDVNGCTATANASISSSFLSPTVNITLDQAIPICANECSFIELDFTGTPPFVLSYQITVNTTSFMGTLTSLNVKDTIEMCSDFFGTNVDSIRFDFINLQDANCQQPLSEARTFFVSQLGRDTIQQTLCLGDSLLVNGTVYNQSNPTGTEIIPGGAANGCDSTIMVNLSFFPPAAADLNATICENDSLVINGTVYNLLNASGTEILPGAAANGCDSIVNISLNFFPPIVFDLNQTICETDSLIVNGTIYNRNNPSGTETFIGAAANGCDSTVNVMLQFFPTAVFDLASTICENDSLVINGTVYNLLNASGTEILPGAAANGCDSIVNISLNFFPPIVFDLNQTICETDSLIVNGTIYNRNNPSGTEIFIGAAANGCDSTVNVALQFFPAAVSNLNLSLCEGETLTVNGRVYDQFNPTGLEVISNASVNGCDSTVNINLSFFAPAVFDLNQTLCEGESIVVNGITYDQNKPNGLEILAGASANGCDSTVNINLSFIQATRSVVEESLCPGQSLVVNGKVYDQSNPSGIEVIAGGSANGCDSIIEVRLSFLPPVFGAIEGSTGICSGETATLTFRLSGAQLFDVRYTDGRNPAIELNDITDGYTVQVSPNQTSTYSIELISVESISCPAEIRGSATIQVSDISAVASVASNFGGFGVSCADSEDAVLSVSTGVNFPPFSYQWSNGATTAQVRDVGAGNYRVTVTDALGCTATDNAVVTAPEPILLQNSTTDVTCVGDNNGTILVETLQGGSGRYEVSLDGSSYRLINTIPYRLSGLNAGNYTVFVRDANGCEINFEANISASSQAQLELGDNQTIRLGDSIELVGQVNFIPSKIQWSPVAGLSSPDLLRTFVSPQTTTTYILTVADTAGCLARDQVTIFVNKERGVFIPSAFSPNEDGSNDIFYINGGNDVVMIKKFLIFDRWGNLMFQKDDFLPNDPQHGWDGLFKNQEVSLGIYVYYAEIEFIDGKTEFFKGEITLLR